MDAGHHLPNRIDHQDRLTVGDLHHKKPVRCIRDHGIPGQQVIRMLPRGLPAVFPYFDDFRSVDLAAKNQVACICTAGNEPSVPGDMIRMVSDTEADIHTLVRAGAVAAMPGKNTVPNVRQILKLRKFEAFQAVLLMMYHLNCFSTLIPCRIVLQCVG